MNFNMMNYRHPLYAHELGHALGYASHDDLVKKTSDINYQSLKTKFISDLQ